MLAVGGFERDEQNSVIAKGLRVSVRSVERWRRSWRDRGRATLRTSGPAKRPKVDDGDFAMLELLLLEGAMAQGWAEERWTLSRVRLLVADQQGVSLSVHSVWELLQRHGWSCQQPARRAAEPDDAAVAGWVKETWPRASHRGGARGMAGLRGRSRRLDDVAPRTHPGTQRGHTRGSVQWRLPRPHHDGRAGLLQVRRTQPAPFGTSKDKHA